MFAMNLKDIINLFIIVSILYIDPKYFD